MKERDMVRELLEDLLVEKEKENQQSLVEKYIELANEYEEKRVLSSKLLFQNIKMGEERGEFERKLKVYQSKIAALKATELYIDTLMEETSVRVTDIERELKKLSEEEEVKEYMEKNKNLK